MGQPAVADRGGDATREEAGADARREAGVVARGRAEALGGEKEVAEAPCAREVGGDAGVVLDGGGVAADADVGEEGEGLGPGSGLGVGIGRGRGGLRAATAAVGGGRWLRGRGGHGQGHGGEWGSGSGDGGDASPSVQTAEFFLGGADFIPSDRKARKLTVLELELCSAAVHRPEPDRLFSRPVSSDLVL